MAIDTYHQLAGRQARGTGTGRQGLRYDVPIGTFQTRPAMPAQEDYAEPVAEAVAEDALTPVDVLVDEALTDEVGAEDVGMSPGLPASADPVSSGDPTSDPAFGATEEGDRAKSPMQAGVEAFANEVGTSLGKKSATSFGLNLAGIPASLSPAPTTPAAAIGLAAKGLVAGYKAKKQYTPPPRWEKTMVSGLGKESPSGHMADVASDMTSNLPGFGGLRDQADMDRMNMQEAMNAPPTFDIPSSNPDHGLGSPGKGAHGGMAGEADVSGLAGAEAAANAGGNAGSSSGSSGGSSGASSSGDNGPDGPAGPGSNSGEAGPGW